MKNNLLKVLVPGLMIIGFLVMFNATASLPWHAGSAVSISIQDLKSDSGVNTPDTLSAISSKKGFSIGNMILGILLLAFYLFAVVVIVMRLIEKKRFTPVTAEGMTALRRSQSKPDSSPEDDKKAWDYLEQAFKTWKIVSGKGEEEFRSPTTMAQIKTSHSFINQAVALMPTDEHVVARLNELGNILNNQEKRSFTGSWKLIIVGIIAGIITYFMESSSASFWTYLTHWWWLWFGIVLYYFASYAPVFLQEKRQRWLRGKNIHNVLIGSILGLLIATPATETWVTTWSDGSKSKSDEINPFYIIMLIITFIVIMVLGFFIIFFAAINFIRNYLLYV